MGMHISSSSAQSIYRMPYSVERTQRHQQFDALAQALQSGNANAANSAYAALVPSGSTVDPNSPLGKIGSALQAGNLAAAQAALPPRFQNAASGVATTPFALNDPTATSTDGGSSSTQATTGTTQSASLGAGEVGHHHHHHHGGGGGMDALFGNATSTNGSSLSGAQGNSDLTTAAFLNARAAMTTLVSDLQNMASSVTSSASPAAATTAPSSNTATGAANLLKNPDFQNLESAFNSGDPTSVNSAWAQFIANTFGTTSSTATASASTVSTVA
jgi:hypothetical protein